MAARSTAMKASMAAETHDVDVIDADDDLFAPTRMLLFAPLGSTDMPSAVVHRLRAAIGLGLLPDGRRLPKEADLATQLGVTTFALREALAALREQGLLVTKAGKYGGSFITYPADSERLEHDELVELSSAELRDVGDWRQMLAARAAALAAQRASESNIAMLTTYAARVGDAESSLDARRAHGRFLLELAAAAQSMRMTRAEFAVHEQIDWLFGLALQTPDERAASSAGLTEITQAIRSRDPHRARSAAEGYVSGLLDRLARLRFERIAQRRHEGGAAESTTLAGELEVIVARLTEALHGFAEDTGPVLAAGGTFDAVRSRIALVALQRIEAFPEFVKGTGVLTEVGVMPDHPYWIQWWQRTEAGPVADNHHVLDPQREDFYDYEMREFIDVPRRLRVPCAYGPYVDYGGEDDFALSITSPIVVDGAFYGITCVDVLIGDLESWLSGLLAAAGESYLINAERRVIVSNSATHGAGDVMTLDEGFDAQKFAPFGWTLLTRRPVAPSRNQ